MAKPGLYDYLYLSFMFSLICGDLPFFIVRKNDTLHIVKTTWTKRWYQLNSAINFFLIFEAAFSSRSLLIIFKSRQADSLSLIFLFSKFIMSIYILQRLFLRNVLHHSASVLWEELMKIDENWKFIREINFRKLILISEIKLSVMQTMNSVFIILWCIRFEVDFLNLCFYEYISVLFTSLLFAYHVLYIIIAEMIDKLTTNLNEMHPDNHLKIKQLSAAYGDIIEIANRTNGYLSIYIFSIFSFAGIQVVAYSYSLFKFAKTNSTVEVISIVIGIIVSVFLSVGWFVLLAENCLNKLTKLKRTLFTVSLRSNDPAVLTEVKFLSLQLLHDYFKVSGAGFFEINYKLLLTCGSTALMYVVLLVQTDEAFCTIINGFMRSL